MHPAVWEYTKYVKVSDCLRCSRYRWEYRWQNSQPRTKQTCLETLTLQYVGVEDQILLILLTSKSFVKTDQITTSRYKNNRKYIGLPLIFKKALKYLKKILIHTAANFVLFPQSVQPNNVLIPLNRQQFCFRIQLFSITDRIPVLLDLINFTEISN